MVVFVFGIIAGIAAINVGRSSAGNSYEEARQLYLKLKLAREDAVLLNRQYGLNIQLDEQDRFSYRWLRFRETDESWFPFSDEGLSPRTLPNKLSIELELEDTDIQLTELRESLGDQDQELQPQVLILSSGELTPFQLRFDTELPSGETAPAVIIRGSLLGQLKLFYEDDDEAQSDYGY